MKTLVERLRARDAQIVGEGSATYNPKPDLLCAEAADEIDKWRNHYANLLQDAVSMREGLLKRDAEIERMTTAARKFNDFLSARLPDGGSWWSRTPLEVLAEWIEARAALEKP
jgi:hypothetical protein